MSTITLPPKAPGQHTETWEDVPAIVVTGANGTGKSRLGVWIEENNPGRQVHRIAAQRALNLPDLVTPMPYDRAALQLRYGAYEPAWNEAQYQQQKRHRRWGGEPVLRLLSDYDLVVAMLFADESRRNRKYATEALAQLPTSKPLDCSLDILQKIWKVIFPHRELLIEQDRISARLPSNGTSYAGKMMSDGERVALYLLGQVLCAPENAIIVIDEPEIHLHQAIQNSLWDHAESSRSDCVFVYITHDLEFAAGRSRARKVWTKRFDGTHWEWDEVDELVDLPDELLLQVLGSRRPVMLVEGDANSFDSTLYRALFPDRTILPMANCAAVIGARRGMERLRSFHKLEIKGLVDRDHRSDDAVDALRSQGISVADVAEVENLFCISQALVAASKHLGIVDGPKAIEEAKNNVISRLEDQKQLQTASRAIAEIQFRLDGFGPKSSKVNSGNIAKLLADHVGTINVESIYQEAENLFDDIVSTRDYDRALKYFNCKGIPSFVCRPFGVSVQTYCAMIVSMVRADGDGDISSAMRAKIMETCS